MCKVLKLSCSAWLAGMVVYGGSQTSTEGHQLGWNDAIGIGIGTISMLGMAVFYVYVQKTEGVIAEDLVLYVEYATMCLTLPFLSLALEPNDWDAILHYDALDWGNLLFTSLGVGSLDYLVVYTGQSCRPETLYKGDQTTWCHWMSRNASPFGHGISMRAVTAGILWNELASAVHYQTRRSIAVCNGHSSASCGLHCR